MGACNNKHLRRTCVCVYAAALQMRMKHHHNLVYLSASHYSLVYLTAAIFAYMLQHTMCGYQIRIPMYAWRYDACAYAGAYKIPAAADIPLDLRVTLLDPRNSPDDTFAAANLVHSSKNTGAHPFSTSHADPKRLS